MGSPKEGHRQTKNLQSPSNSLKPGGAIAWSVCIQTKPVVRAIPRMKISPMRSMRRTVITFGEADVFTDMAFSFLCGMQTWYIDRVIERDIRIASLLIAVCLLVDRLSVV